MNIMTGEQRPLFRNRTEAGRRLAGELASYKGKKNILILALPRGGVPVGYEVARYLGAPLDIFLVRKLGVPGHEELAMGAIASGGVRVLNEGIVRSLRVTAQAVEDVAEREYRELNRREKAYRADRPVYPVNGRKVILVDDGLATGATMRAAVTALRMREPSEIIVAVPTASPDTCLEFEKEVDRVICAETPQPFQAVGLWYEDFSQTTDEEVSDYLRLADDITGTLSR